MNLIVSALMSVDRHIYICIYCVCVYDVNIRVGIYIYMRT